jgi:general L-amino acid transport system substrate-binding protein
VNRSILCALATVAILPLATVAWAAGTLDVVRARGQLVCGVNTGLAGFSLPDSRGEWRGLDADYCRAIAAAALGDPARSSSYP